MRCDLALLGLAACFDPAYRDATRCGSGGECPPGRVCAGDTCRASASALDAPPAGDAPVAGFSVVAGAPPWIVRGRGAVPFEVRVNRGGGFGGPVMLSLANLPAGVSATMLTVTSVEGTLEISALSTAALGPAMVTLLADGGTAGVATGPVGLMVADPPGTVDVTLGGGTVEIQPFGPATYTPTAVLLREGGGFVVVDDSTIVDSHEMALDAFHADGSVDDGFGTIGQTTISAYEASAMAAQSDGHLVAVGSAFDMPGTALLRWNADGTRDLGFGASGITVDSGDYSPTGIAIQPDGRIVYSGNEKSTMQPEICRASAAGVLDDSFAGGAGCWVAENTGAGIAAITVAADGRIFAAGTTMAVTFYTAVLDADGTHGIENPYPSTAFKFAGNSVAVSGDEPVVAGLLLGVSTPQRAALARSTDGGGADTSFGGGILIPDLGGNPSGFYGVAVQVDGKIVAAGANSTSGLVARFTSDGKLDTGFGTAGVATVAGTTRLGAIRVLPDGRVLAAGTAMDGNAVVVRIWP